MNAKTFRDMYGRKKAEEVAIKAGTNYRYFHQMVKGKRRPGWELALRLVEASNNELDVASLMTAKKTKEELEA